MKYNLYFNILLNNIRWVASNDLFTYFHAQRSFKNALQFQTV